MNQHDPSVLDTILLNLALIGAWLAGEAGRAALAGAAGGLVRWLMSEKTRIRDGAISIITGILMAKYASPLMLAILEKWFDALKGDVVGMAGFAAGIAGMSIAKILLALVDAQFRKTGGSDA